jgi:dGTPase
MPLAPYAVSETNSRGRQYPVVLAKDRTAFQRDYTRILHSQAFRRLQGKTQVFGGYRPIAVRSRMSHSMEVEQISRSLARQMNLNQDLCAALAIGHDMGHAPFGHLGQDALDLSMKQYGGFEHNHQALRLVDELECPYPAHPGLNLMFETREGLLKHCRPARAAVLGDIAKRHLNGQSPTLEAQAVDVSDALAYLHADLEDAVLLGVITLDQLDVLEGFTQAKRRIQAMMPGQPLPMAAGMAAIDPAQAANHRTLFQEVMRNMLAHAIEDVVRASKVRLLQDDPKSPDHARSLPPLIGFAEESRANIVALRKFSRDFIYDSPSVREERNGKDVLVQALFSAAVDNPEFLGVDPVQLRLDPYRAAADRVAAMTDAEADDWGRRLSIETVPARKAAP